MSRIIKDPEVRKQEIIDTAMQLFHKKGYDATSIADIAKAMNVVPGLCYRYFSSKQEIFDQAVKQYARECCQDFLAVIRNREVPLEKRLDAFGSIMIHKEDRSRYHDFYHTPGNETFHLQLSIEMFRYLAPYISEELQYLHEKGEVQVENPGLLTDFLLYGQASLWLAPDSPDPHSDEFKRQLEQLKSYVCKLLGL